MKQYLLSFLFLTFLYSLSAQITVDNESFPQVGDTLRTAIDAMPGDVSITAAGGDQRWDFSDLQGLAREVVIQPASEGQAFSDFSSANILVELGQVGELYYDSNTSTYELQGFFGRPLDQFDLQLVAKYDPALVERRAPMDYLDNNNSQADLLLPFSIEELPTELTDSLPVTPDSLRIRRSATINTFVDAWGELEIPGATYDVLRVRQIQVQETRLDVKIGFGPFSIWQDITDVLLGGGGLADMLGGDTTTTYSFMSNEAKEPIAVLTINPLDDSVLSVEYKAEKDVVSSTTGFIKSGRADIYAYPNPAIDEARFDFVNLPNGQYTLKLYNILGVEVMKEQYDIQGNFTVKLNLSKMRKGTYLYSLVNERGKTITTKRLMIIRP
ncbi:MAG: T9SS type A sorting domain-containing protein [Bacteroidota bacterium]